jgi:hypothetical protein
LKASHALGMNTLSRTSHLLNGHLPKLAIVSFGQNYWFCANCPVQESSYLSSQNRVLVIPVFFRSEALASALASLKSDSHALASQSKVLLCPRPFSRYLARAWSAAVVYNYCPVQESVLRWLKSALRLQQWGAILAQAFPVPATRPCRRAMAATLSMASFDGVAVSVWRTLSQS